MMDQKQKDEYKKALVLVDDLYPTAHILAKAQMIIRDDEGIRIDQLSDLLKQDISLTADVLKASNSVHYGYADPSKDLETSVSRIGLGELLKLLALVIAKNVYSKDLDHYGITAKECWEESVACAMVMDWVSGCLGKSRQEGYTIGLLSVIGKTVINQAFEMFGDEYEWDSSQSVCAWETAVLGFDHAHAGSILLKRWEFPVDIIGPVKYQFRPEEDPNLSVYSGALGFTRELVDQAGNDIVPSKIEFNDSMKGYLSRLGLSQEACIEGLKDVSANLSSFKQI